MGRSRKEVAARLSKLLGIVAAGLLVGAGFGLGLGSVANRGGDEHAARMPRSAAPATATDVPAPAATADSHALTPIEVPGAEDGDLHVLYLGDDLLSAYRPAVTQALRAHRKVLEEVHALPARAPAPRGAFATLGARADLIFLGVGTGDLQHATNAEAFNTVYKGVVRRLHVRFPRARLVCLGVHGALEARQTQVLDQVIGKRCRNDTFIPITRVGAPKQIATAIVPRLRF